MLRSDSRESGVEMRHEILKNGRDFTADGDLESEQSSTRSIILV